jgi:outer membrane protein assembly factor BamB
VVGELRPEGRVLGLGEDGELTELVADLPRIQTPVPVGDELWLQAGASVVVIGPGGAIEIFDPAGGGRVVAGDGALLVGTGEGRTHFDPTRRTAVSPVPGNSASIAFTVPSVVSLQAVGLGAAWDIGSSSIIRTDLATGVRQEVALAALGVDVVIGPDTVWVGTGDGRILRLDPATGALIEDVDVLEADAAVHLVGSEATPWAVDREVVIPD